MTRDSSPPSRRAVVAIGVGAVTIDSALLGLVAPLLPEIEARTGAGDAAVGLALAAYAVPIALLLTAPWARRRCRRPPQAARRRVSILATGSVLVAISDSIGMLMAARAVQGVGSAASWISALALVSDTAPPGAPRRGARGCPRRNERRLDRRPGARRRDRPAALVRGPVPDLLRPRARAGGGGAGRPPPEGGRTTSAVPALPAIMRSTRSGLGAWAAAIMLGGPARSASSRWWRRSTSTPASASRARRSASCSPPRSRSTRRCHPWVAAGEIGAAAAAPGRRLAVTAASMLALAVLPGVGGTPSRSASTAPGSAS